jgi:hypothetical protein
MFGYATTKNQRYVVQYTLLANPNTYDIVINGQRYRINADRYILDKVNSALMMKSANTQICDDSKLNLEIGKTYFNKEGTVSVKIVGYETDKKYLSEPAFIGLLLNQNDKTKRNHVILYKKDGTCFSGSCTYYTLVTDKQVIDIHTYTWVDQYGTIRSAASAENKIPVGLAALLQLNPHYQFNKTMTKLFKSI